MVSSLSWTNLFIFYCLSTSLLQKYKCKHFNKSSFTDSTSSPLTLNLSVSSLERITVLNLVLLSYIYIYVFTIYVHIHTKKPYRLLLKNILKTQKHPGDPLKYSQCLPRDGSCCPSPLNTFAPTPHRLPSVLADAQPVLLLYFLSQQMV